MAKAQETKIVWGEYTREELDYEYNQRNIVPNAEQYLARNSSDSARVRGALECRLDVPYGSGADELLDIFPAPRRDAPVLVYIHGGAWTRMHKDMASYQAESFVGAGAAYVSVNYSLAPAASLDEMVRQNRAAIAWVHRNARDFGADPERLFVAGHSAGGHLAGMMVTTDWDRAFGLPRNVIKGGLLCSGTYELEPVRLSARNEYLKLDEAAVERNSPIRHIADDGCPLVIGYGELEHREFRRQARAFAEAWRARGLACQEFDLPGLNHFDVGQQFNRPESPILAAMFESMEL